MNGWMFQRMPIAAAVVQLMTMAAVPMQAQAQLAPAAVQVAQADLKTVVISGSRSERALADVPASVDVLSGDDLDAAQVQDIRDLVRHTPNLSVKRAPQRFGGVNTATGRDGNAGFNIRGLEGNRVLLTVDGIRQPREMSSGTLGPVAFGRDYVDLGLVSRVEILRGSHSALYGSDGLAGMVAMFTTEPQDLLPKGQKDATLGGRALVSYASEDGMRRVGGTVAGKPNDTVQWLLGATLTRAHELDNQGSNAALNSTRTAPNPQQDRQAALLGKLVLTPGGGQKHTFALEHIDKRAEVEAYSGRARTTGRTAASSWDVTDLDGKSDMSRDRLSWDGRFKLGQPWADEVRTLAAVQRADAQEVTYERRTNLSNVVMPLRSRDVRYQEHLTQVVVQAEKTWPLSEAWVNKLVYGVDVSTARMDNIVTGLEPPSYEKYPLKRFPKTTEQQTALFVQTELANEHWSIIPALRYDRFKLNAASDTLYPLTPASLSDGALSPKLGLIFRASDAVSVYGNLATGFKSPSPTQLNSFFENVTGFYKTIPNPTLKPETSRTLELGVRGHTGIFDWDVTAFHGRYKDFIEDLVQVAGTGQPGNPLVYQSVNRAAVRISGLELKAAVRLSAATGLKFAFGQTRGTDTAAGKPLNSVNPAKWVVGVDHKLGDWTLGATLTHVAAKSAKDIHNTLTVPNTPFATPAYTTLDLKAVWQLKRGSKLSVALHNVTNKTYWDWTNVRGLASNSPVLDAYTAPGRSISVAWATDF
ncbi:MAG: hypothetical protein RLZZ612_2362 [Pseudomonadota bacterium]|jgi:hemoglobin/transferrin/lactoferrin receptor protein